jgi:uncharacterized metal-binding protein YceD (DUF177 family)
MSKGVAPAVEFSRLILADQIGVQETVREIAANAAECAALAERFGLLSLDRLTASLGLVRRRSGLIEVHGRFEADLVQACVVTLEPVPAQLAAAFSVSFGVAPEASGADEGGEVVVSVEGEDPPEAIVEGRIDLGEVVAQQLAVAIDPYPRSPAAAAAGSAEPEGEAGRKPSPFAGLAAWRRPEGD